MPLSRGHSNLSDAYSLVLLAEYTNTLDALPLDVSRSFADLRELDAVMSAGMASITTKIQNLTQMIEQGTVPKEERLWLLTDIADEATRLKPGGEDKIRVAAQAADHLKSHNNHLKQLAENLPGFDASTLIRQTTYPHVAAKSYMPLIPAESGRRRRGGVSSQLLSTAPDPSPIKRKRNTREEELEAKSPRKDKAGDGSRARNGVRKKNERAVSPAESMASVTSHRPPQNGRDHNSASRGLPNGSRAGNGTAAAASNGNKRARSNIAQASPGPNEHYSNSPSYSAPNMARRDGFNVPPSSSSHPSLPPPFLNGHSGYDLPASNANPDWNTPRQLEGPGMPVARTYRPVTPPLPINGVGGAPTDGAGTEVGEGEGDGDDTLYCFCQRVSYGEMIACDDNNCEREWFHLACIGLTIPPDGRWFCEPCKNKRNAKRSGRGGKRRNGGRARGGT
ncbi:hypothetical protein C8J56DRAFT_773740 [Mycena floridula]|nr:hypothetical protein C8J56DRAFT_773740 [Mycena floridula]